MVPGRVRQLLAHRVDLSPSNVANHRQRAKGNRRRCSGRMARRFPGGPRRYFRTYLSRDTGCIVGSRPTEAGRVQAGATRQIHAARQSHNPIRRPMRNRCLRTGGRTRRVQPRSSSPVAGKLMQELPLTAGYFVAGFPFDPNSLFAGNDVMAEPRLQFLDGSGNDVTNEFTRSD